MCWTTETKEHAKPLKSKSDIRAIKFLIVHGQDLKPPFYYGKYNIGKAMPVIHIKCEKAPWMYGNYAIEEGYHSYQYGALDSRPPVDNTSVTYYMFAILYPDGKKARIQWINGNDAFLVPYECIIPKGTKYYINEDHEIVSETIIVKEPIMRLTETIE